MSLASDDQKRLRRILRQRTFWVLLAHEDESGQRYVKPVKMESISPNDPAINLWNHRIREVKPRVGEIYCRTYSLNFWAPWPTDIFSTIEDAEEYLVLLKLRDELSGYN